MIDLGACAGVTAVHAYAACSRHVSICTQMSDTWSEVVMSNTSSIIDALLRLYSPAAVELLSQLASIARVPCTEVPSKGLR